MDLPELIFAALALSADACAAALCKGASIKNPKWRQALVVGLWFGVFQALMPLIGYYAGKGLYSYIEAVDHFIAFGLLALIGGNMIRESFKKEETQMRSSLSIKTMLPLAAATSLDALAVGVGFAMSSSHIGIAWITSVIGCITFIISVLSVKIGGFAGKHFGKHAEFAGGLVLIAIGVKILLEHLGLISF